jgi:DNA-binding XRE family transcriptional regulator
MINEDQFIKNLRMVRGARGLSAKTVSEMAKLKSEKRCIDIEEGRVKCKLEEAVSICLALRVPFESMVTKAVNIEITFIEATKQ